MNIDELIRDATKEQSPLKLNVFRALKNSIQVWEKANPEETISDEDIQRLVKKAVKQREESAQIYEENNRSDMALVENAEIKILSEFLPKMMTNEEIDIAIDKAKQSHDNIGDIMKHLRNEYGQTMNMKYASQKVKSKL